MPVKQACDLSGISATDDAGIIAVQDNRKQQHYS